MPAARELLRFGAGPNIADNEGHSPFLDAVRYGSVELASLLIESKADVRQISNYGENALHLAHAFGLPDLETLLPRILAANGKELVNAQDIDGRTPLSYAAQWCSLALARVLLANGADMEIPDSHGWTPLMWSLNRKHNDVTLLLLQHGANHLSRANNGWTILHFAIAAGDAATLDILASFKLDGLEPEAAAEDGSTATDLLKIRKIPIPDALEEHFQRLVDKLRWGKHFEDRQAIDIRNETSREDSESWVTTDGEDEGESEDEFVDALEEQQNDEGIHKLVHPK